MNASQAIERLMALAPDSELPAAVEPLIPVAAKKLRRWVMYRFIHVTTPYRHIPLVLVTDVPIAIGKEDLKEAIEVAGLEQGEFNIPWANTYVEPVTRESASELRGRLRTGDYATYSYRELVEMGNEVIQ